jgi:hypothetical protein
MRTLKIVCGIAVILATLHIAHGVHHIVHVAGEQSMHGPALWGGMLAAAVVARFSLTGGVLLLMGK